MEEIKMKTLTKQEIFEKAARGLLLQGRKSSTKQGSDGTCFYRGPNGTKCAVGHLIPDDVWARYATPTRNSASVSSLPTSLLDEIGINGSLAFVRDLQLIHDVDAVYEWRSRLKQVAKNQNLDASFIDQIPVHENEKVPA